MAMHLRLQLPAFFLLVFLAFHASSSEQEDYWQMKLPRVPMPDAIKDNLFHSRAAKPLTIDTKEKKANVDQPYTVFSWKYDVDNSEDKAKQEVEAEKKVGMNQPYTVFSWKYDEENKKDKATMIPITIDANTKSSLKQPFTVYSWKYDADNTKEKAENEVEPFTTDTNKKLASMKQPYTVFSWKYDADNTKEKIKTEVEPFSIDTEKKLAGMKQPYTVFSWKYDADNTKEKAENEVEPFTMNTNKEANVKQPYTVFSWKYNAENTKKKTNDEVTEPSSTITEMSKKSNMKQPYTVFSWKYDADEAAIKQPYTVFSWKYNENDKSKATSHPHHHHHHHHQHDIVNSNQEDLSGGTVFFVEKSLLLGSKLKHDFQKTPEIPFLPKNLVQSIPFSMDKYAEILNLFSLKSESAEAIAIKETLGVCLERPKVKKENRTCAQSMEDIVDFVVSELGTNEVEIKMMNNNIEVPNGIQDYVITKVKKLVVPGNTAVACHRMSYPYVVYYCHHQQDIGQYDVTLVSPTSGTAIQTTAVCHYDTYAWQPDVLALKYLGIRPGDAPVCHFSAINDMFWTHKVVDSKSLDMAQ